MARIDPNTEDFIKRALGLKDGEPIPAKVEDEYMRAKYLLDKGSGGGVGFSPQQTALILFATGIDARPRTKVLVGEGKPYEKEIEVVGVPEQALGEGPTLIEEPEEL